MGERLAYYERRNKAIREPKNFLSIIADGMAQNHCVLPWMANLKTFKEVLPQHLQGVTLHGRRQFIYRTFHNIKNGSNLAAHCFLLSLEHVIRKEDKLPDTIYHPIDGGSENVAKMFLGICELLIIKRMTLKIVLSRIGVGHNHEDQDSRFAQLWRRIRDNHVQKLRAYMKN